ncbi:MAG: efflux transporter outer membrane subunit, partial [Gallionellaceae bacterium]|nr:efflux transporter outer membrane subunit [Gallionellaceae bacterium]
NQTVRASYANYQQALASVSIANAALFPTLGITGGVTRQRANVATPVVNSGTLEATAGWQLDVWGQLRRATEESEANAQASQATLAAATLSAQVALVQAIINLRVTDANIDLLQQTVKEYEESLRVVDNQNRAGTIPPSNLETARAQLENAQSSLLNLGIARAQYAHAIAVLVGRNPGDLDLPHNAVLPTLPTIPAMLPSTLLQRRPDIASAERAMAAQNAAIGVAVSGYFPTVSLSGVAGFAQSPLDGLLRAANRVWSLGANAAMPLFNAGATRAEVRAAEAAYDAAVANYRGAVLGAFQNVQDDLAALRILEQQSAVQERATQSATRAAEISFNEYKAGIVDYTTVATAQTSMLATRQTELSLRAQRLQNAAALIGDLGGGWSADQLGKETTLPPETR